MVCLIEVNLWCDFFCGSFDRNVYLGCSDDVHMIVKMREIRFWFRIMCVYVDDHIIEEIYHDGFYLASDNHNLLMIRHLLNA